MKTPPTDSLLHKVLFTPPAWLGRSVRIGFGFLLILFTTFYIYMVWRNVEDFALIKPATGIPGWLVLFEVNLLSLLAIRSGYLLTIGSKRRTIGGVEIGGMSLLSSPYRLDSVSSAEYAKAYPFLFGFSTLMLLFLLGVLVWEWRRGEAVFKPKT